MRVLLAGPDFEENLSIRYLASSLQAKQHEPSLASGVFGSNGPNARSKCDARPAATWKSGNPNLAHCLEL